MGLILQMLSTYLQGIQNICLKFSNGSQFSYSLLICKKLAFQ